MVSPVPPLGLFHTGSPSHCAAAGVARNADNATVNAARISALSGGWWRFGRLEEVGGGCGGGGKNPPNPPHPPPPPPPPLFYVTPPRPPARPPAAACPRPRPRPRPAPPRDGG